MILITCPRVEEEKLKNLLKRRYYSVCFEDDVHGSY